MVVKIELRDKSFNIIDILDNEKMALTWEFLRIGGCGSFSFNLPRQYCNERSISGDFNIRIYKRNSLTNVYDLSYQGIVEDKVPDISNIDETVTIQGHGYQVQLSRIQLINKTYTGQEASVIIKDLLDNFIVPNTDVIYSGADISATSFIFDSITFNTDVLSAIQTIADTVGGLEFGVNGSRSFYFKARSTTTGLRFTVGDKMTAFNDDYSFKDIVNRVIVQGGDVAGTPFAPDSTTSPYNDAPSQLKYGRRDQVYQNSSIVTDAVARQFAASVLLEKKDVVHNARAELVNYETQIESTIPIPLLEIVSRGTLYGEKNYGTFLYSGKIQYQVNRIVYTLSDEDGSLVTDLEMGQPRPSESELIAQLTYKLEQLRTAAL